mmetsp:Transcript_46012/g.146961  ORF Transcript_46012/g.146961 Transcript_46012/m.146961 type:complete len:240 (+) Transcript_46012:184-903(+)
MGAQQGPLPFSVNLLERLVGYHRPGLRRRRPGGTTPPGHLHRRARGPRPGPALPPQAARPGAPGAGRLVQGRLGGHCRCVWALRRPLAALDRVGVPRAREVDRLDGSNGRAGVAAGDQLEVRLRPVVRPAVHCPGARPRGPAVLGAAPARVPRREQRGQREGRRRHVLGEAADGLARCTCHDPLDPRVDERHRPAGVQPDTGGHVRRSDGLGPHSFLCPDALGHGHHRSEGGRNSYQKV